MKHTQIISAAASGVFRGDIAGLRAIAVLGVVIYHLMPSALPGGFVGVDVFFVLSGFLITGLLWREYSTSGRIRVARFYGRRARRLLPASLLMILAVVVAALFVYPYWVWESVLLEALAAILYGSNILFAVQSQDYFTESLELPNPLLHTWTLGVEEQFYFILPALFILLIFLYRTRNVKTVVLVWLSALTVFSFVASVLLSAEYSASSFFLLHTRLWEFALGGIAAVALYRRETDSYLLVDSKVPILPLVGLVAIFGSFFLYSPSLVYPGYWAALPVLGTLAILISHPNSIIARLLSLSPFVWIGAISYSWYLWHYAPIILIPEISGLSNGWNVLFALSLGLGFAIISYYLVENPFRYKIFTEVQPGRVLIISTAATAILSLLLFAAFRANIEYKANAAIAVQETATAEEFASPAEETFVPFVEELPDTEGEDSSPPVITSLEGLEVLLIGDSHAKHWEEALDQAVDNLGGTLISHSLLSCPGIDVYVTKLDGSAMREGCKEHRNKAFRLATEADVVILSQAEHYLNRVRDSGGSRVDADRRDKIWETAYEEWLNEYLSLTVPLGVFADNPKIPGFNPADCVRFKGPVPECNTTVEDVETEMGSLPLISHSIRNKVLPEASKQVFDVYSLICKSSGECETSENGIPVYSDNQHLSETWTVSKVPMLEAYLLGLVNSYK